MNQINVIYPYPVGSTGWAFDEPRVGLHAEPFVGGTETIIDIALEYLNIPKGKVKFTFSKDWFPDVQFIMKRSNKDCFSGSYYTTELNEQTHTGWLCPATLKFFKDYPEEIYVRIEALN